MICNVSSLSALLVVCHFQTQQGGVGLNVPVGLPENENQ